MSGAEVFAVIGLLSSLAGLVESTVKAYKAIKDFRKLPQVIQEAAKDLDLVEVTLNAAISSHGTRVDNATWTFIKAQVEKCDIKISSMKDIFEKLGKSENNKMKAMYTSLMFNLGKQQRVEELMKGIMNDVQALASNRIFSTATQSQVEELKVAIQKLMKMEPSVPDHVFQVSGDYNQNISNNINTVHGNQYNTAGDTHIYYSGFSKSTFVEPSAYLTAEIARQQEIRNWLQLYHNVPLVSLTSAHISFDEGKILPNTGKWMLDNETYQEWEDTTTENNILWLHGDAGFGKSFVCTKMLQRLQKIYKETPTVAVASHYYDFSDDSIKKTMVYQNIAQDLFYKLYGSLHYDIPDEVYAFSRRPASLQNLKEFIVMMTIKLDTTYIFLDGLDEAQSPDRWTEAEDILIFFLKLVTRLGKKGKLWCSSQNRRNIRDTLRKYPHASIQLTSVENADDVSLLLDNQKLLDDIPTHDREEALKAVKKGVNGNMLWASLMMETMRHASDQRELMAMVKEGLPTTFEEYLKRKVDSITVQNLQIAR
jgi:N-terminal domain on NACHT_NTPase and P-loop NTPases